VSAAPNAKEVRWPEIEAKLLEVRRHLLTDACVTRKDGIRSPDVWVLRYRDYSGERPRQCSIHLGGAAMAERARELIHRWRAEAVSDDELRERDLMQLCRWLGIAGRYTGRAQRRLATKAKGVVSDPVAALAFVYSTRCDDPTVRFGKPPGRPAKSGLL
jgi:hypothetical protein